MHYQLKTLKLLREILHSSRHLLLELAVFPWECHHARDNSIHFFWGGIDTNLSLSWVAGKRSSQGIGWKQIKIERGRTTKEDSNSQQGNVSCYSYSCPIHKTLSKKSQNKPAFFIPASQQHRLTLTWAEPPTHYQAKPISLHQLIQQQHSFMPSSVSQCFS